MWFEFVHQLKAIVQMLDHLKSNDGVKLCQVDLIDVCAWEFGIFVPVLLFGHIDDDGVVIEAKICDVIW